MKLKNGWENRSFSIKYKSGYKNTLCRSVPFYTVFCCEFVKRASIDCPAFDFFCLFLCFVLFFVLVFFLSLADWLITEGFYKASDICSVWKSLTCFICQS